MTQSTRIGKQNNPALLRPTDLPGTHTTSGYRLLLDGARAIIKMRGWDALKTIADAISARYTALLAAPTRLGASVSTQPVINNVVNPKVGVKLSVVTPTYDGLPKPTVAYQWIRGAATNVGTNSQQYTPVVGDVGQTLKCQLTVSNGQGANLVETTPVTAAVIA